MELVVLGKASVETKTPVKNFPIDSLQVPRAP